MQGLSQRNGQLHQLQPQPQVRRQTRLHLLEELAQVCHEGEQPRHGLRLRLEQEEPEQNRNQGVVFGTQKEVADEGGEEEGGEGLEQVEGEPAEVEVVARERVAEVEQEQRGVRAEGEAEVGDDEEVRGWCDAIFMRYNLNEHLLVNYRSIFMLMI